MTEELSFTIIAVRREKCQQRIALYLIGKIGSTLTLTKCRLSKISKGPGFELGFGRFKILKVWIM